MRIGGTGPAAYRRYLMMLRVLVAALFVVAAAQASARGQSCEVRLHLENTGSTPLRVLPHHWDTGARFYDSGALSQRLYGGFRPDREPVQKLLNWNSPTQLAPDQTIVHPHRFERPCDRRLTFQVRYRCLAGSNLGKEAVAIHEPNRASTVTLLLGGCT